MRGGGTTRGASTPIEASRVVFRSWTWRVSAAESVGFLAPAIAGVLSLGLAAPAGVATVLLAGALEGAVLGLAQASVLRGVLPGLHGGRWTALTAGAAVAAYALGFLMSQLGASGSPLGFVGAAAAGLLLLGTIGGAQWLELRHHVPQAVRWIGWTAVAWLAALGTFLAIATPLWHPGQSVINAVAVGVAAGIAMAVVQAAGTGLGIVRLVSPVTAAEDVGPCPAGSVRPTMKS
ncbi:hypothetical protein [Nocardioides silvaticus]|uniref:hypothetical protein n=1 Tax=Nocardioides silvaticus TaxID=2201891 RepID=UPI001304CBA3|nr:hypothetical protein [Nocardioides silvaticus]